MMRVNSSRPASLVSMKVAPFRPWRPLILTLLLTAAAIAQTPAPPADTLVMANGERRPGHIVSMDAQGFMVEVQIVPGQPPGTVRIPRNQVAEVEFAPDPARETLLSRATAAQLPAAAAYWQKAEPYLALPKSPAARIALRYVDLLVESGDPANAAKALALLARLEKEAWNPDDRTATKQARLRAKVASGKPEEAAAEAREMLKGNPPPDVQTEAKFILARASEELLRKLLEENPRWEEDDRIRPERARLLNDSLDYYLYPSLFAGAVSEPAARGLWGAIGVYKLIGETTLAAESAHDIITLHPGTRYVKLAQDFIASLPKGSGAPASTAPSFANP